MHLVFRLVLPLQRLYHTVFEAPVSIVHLSESATKVSPLCVQLRLVRQLPLCCDAFFPQQMKQDIVKFQINFVWYKKQLVSWRSANWRSGQASDEKSRWYFELTTASYASSNILMLKLLRLRAQCRETARALLDSSTAANSICSKKWFRKFEFVFDKPVFGPPY